MNPARSSLVLRFFSTFVRGFHASVRNDLIQFGLVVLAILYGWQRVGFSNVLTWEAIAPVMWMACFLVALNAIRAAMLVCQEIREELSCSPTISSLLVTPKGDPAPVDRKITYPPYHLKVWSSASALLLMASMASYFVWEQSRCIGFSVKVPFKNSPFFTERRKCRMSREVSAFRDYLVRIGFQMPSEMPPFGVGPTTIRFGWTGQIPKDYDNEEIYMAKSKIDEPYAIVERYATWAFFTRIFPYSPDRPELRFNNNLANLYANYYEASFRNRHIPISATIYGPWNEALWKIRARYGQDLTDKMIFYAYKNLREPVIQETFDDFFLSRFEAGFDAIDNMRGDRERSKQMRAELKSILSECGLPRVTQP